MDNFKLKRELNNLGFQSQMFMPESAIARNSSDKLFFLSMLVLQQKM